MRKHLHVGLATCLALCVFACKNSNAPSAAPAAPLRSDTQAFYKKDCISEGQCAIFDVKLPVLAGGDTAVTARVNASVQSYVRSVVGANELLAFPVAMDSAALAFVGQYRKDWSEGPPPEGMSYLMEINGGAPLLNTKIATLQLEGSAYAGGAHPAPFAMLVSYDLASGGKALTAADLLRDTNAVRPLLETGYKLSKGMKPEDDIRELLYPESPNLPIAAHVAVLPQGLVFYYNAYEVAPYAVGPAEILLSWEQLGDLADKQKWLD
jgi:hypothetical protein